MTQRTKYLIVPGLFLLAAASSLLAGLKQSLVDNPPKYTWLVFSGSFFALGMVFLGVAKKFRQPPGGGDRAGS